MALRLKKGVKQPLEEATARTRGISAADWRTVLSAAALTDMGMQNVLHLEGGFGEWKKAGRPVGERPQHKPKA